MTIDSVADVAERQASFPNKSTKVGLLMFFIVYFVTRDLQAASIALLAHAVLSLIF